MRFFAILLSFVLIIASSLPLLAEDIKIAVNLPMTGKIGIYGNQIKNGIMLGASEVNFEDSRGRKYKFDWQDNKSEIKDANTIFMLQKASNPDIFITGLKPQFEVINLQILKLNKPHFAWVWDPIMNEGKAGNNFQTWNNFRAESDCFLKHLDSKKLKRVVFPYVQLPSTDFQAESLLRPLLESRGIEFITIPFSYEETDFKSIALKIKQNSPDFIIWNGFLNQLISLLKEGKSLDLINSSNNLFSMDILDAPGIAPDKLLDDVKVCVPEYLQELNSKKLQSWVKKYQKMFNEEPLYHAMYAYDQFEIIHAASTNVSNAQDSKEWLNAIRTVEVDGLVNKLKFDASGSLKIDLKIMAFNNGRLGLD